MKNIMKNELMKKKKRDTWAKGNIENNENKNFFSFKLTKSNDSNNPDRWSDQI